MASVDASLGPCGRLLPGSIVRVGYVVSFWLSVVEVLGRAEYYRGLVFHLRGCQSNCHSDTDEQGR